MRESDAMRGRIWCEKEIKDGLLLDGRRVTRRMGRRLKVKDKVRVRREWRERGMGVDG